MLFDSINLVEGSEVFNLVVDKGPVFPGSESEGELFYNDGTGAFPEALYIYNGSTWVRQLDENVQLQDVLPTVNVPGQYTKVDTDSKGRVIGGSNPTTLTGYGILDAQPLDADLTSIAALSGVSGILKKTGANTWALDTSSYISGNQNMSFTGDATGSGTTAISLTLASTGVAGGNYGGSSFVGTFSVDSKGRLTNATNTSIAIDATAVVSGAFDNPRIAQSAVVQHEAALTLNESQIQDGSIFPRLASTETISGGWTFNTSPTGPSPIVDSHLATKAYVDTVATGLTPHTSVKAASTAPVTASGVQTVDGVALAIGDRVLLKHQADPFANGVYDVKASTWTRSADFDGNPTNEVKIGDLFFVESGTENGNTSWVIVSPGANPVGSSSIQFGLFSRVGDFAAGNGLTRTGNTIDVVSANSGRIVTNVDSIDLATTGISPGNYASLVVDSYGRAVSGSASQPWSTVSGTPTTLTGYGILDAQPLDGDLTSIAGLSGTSGLLRKTAANSWSLDTSSYLTGINSSQVIAALTYTPLDSAAFTNTAVTSKLITGFVSGSGTITASDSILSAINKLSGNIGLATGATNLDTTLSAATVTVTSDTGTDAVIGTATSSNAGVLSAADKSKLDSLTVASIPTINPTTPKDGDIKVAAGPIISIYASSAWRQIFPAVYS